VRDYRGPALPHPFPLHIQGPSDNGENNNPGSEEFWVIPQYVKLEVERHGRWMESSWVLVLCVNYVRVVCDSARTEDGKKGVEISLAVPKG